MLINQTHDLNYKKSLMKSIKLMLINQTHDQNNLIENKKKIMNFNSKKKYI
jgi:hypothetical protein